MLVSIPHSHDNKTSGDIHRVDALFAYNDAITEFRGICVFQKLMPMVEGLEQLRAKMKQHKNEFYLTVLACKRPLMIQNLIRINIFLTC